MCEHLLSNPDWQMFQVASLGGDCMITSVVSDFNLSYPLVEPEMN